MLAAENEYVLPRDDADNHLEGKRAYDSSLDICSTSPGMPWPVVELPLSASTTKLYEYPQSPEYKLIKRKLFLRWCRLRFD